MEREKEKIKKIMGYILGLCVYIYIRLTRKETVKKLRKGWKKKKKVRREREKRKALKIERSTSKN